MYRIKRMAIFLVCAFLLTACKEEQPKSEVLLYKAEKNGKQKEHYKTTTVKKDNLRWRNRYAVFMTNF